MRHGGPLRRSAQIDALVVKDAPTVWVSIPTRSARTFPVPGLVADACEAGTAEVDIMRQTGHRSRAVLEGFYREANRFRGKVSERVGL